MFALPLIRAYKGMPISSRPIAYGFETLTGEMRLVSKKFYGKGNRFIGLDFSKFENTVPAWLVDIAFDILMLNIDFLHYEDHGVADVWRNVHLYDAIRRYHIETPIRLANAQRFKKNVRYRQW
ncbi:hypothetical protein J6590_036251 [Homalodisca vitripennis]|nr:hypothetical protein J6590_036251 [Homalodisca vitripennis]